MFVPGPVQYLSTCRAKHEGDYFSAGSWSLKDAGLYELQVKDPGLYELQVKDPGIYELQVNK